MPALGGRRARRRRAASAAARTCLLAGLPDLREPRRLACRAREPPIASSARAAASEHDLRARALEVGDELVVLEDLRPGGHAQLDALAGRAVLPEPPPDGRASPRSATPLEAERSRRPGPRRETSPPGPPSPPSGPPLGTCFSRRKLSAPSPPRPAFTRMRARSWNTGLLGRSDGDGAALAARGYSTLPSLVAKIVSSRPMPVPGPGGTSCRAGARGSSPPSRPGRRRSSRRAASHSSRGRSGRNRVPSYEPSSAFFLVVDAAGFLAAVARFAPIAVISICESSCGSPCAAGSRFACGTCRCGSSRPSRARRPSRSPGSSAEVRLAVAADEEHVRMERLALVGRDPVHEQPLALADAVLLATQCDDRVVGHRRGKRGHGPGDRPV